MLIPNHLKGKKMAFWSEPDDEEEATPTPESKKAVADARAREEATARRHGEYTPSTNPHI